jgi:hypothetical protein
MRREPVLLRLRPLNPMTKEAEESGTRARAARARKIELGLIEPQVEFPLTPEQRVVKAQGPWAVRWARELTRALKLPESMLMRKGKPKASQEQVKERKQA